MHGGISPQARAYRDAYEPELDPLDFDDIERHSLELADVVVGGVECLRIRSTTGGTANGSMLYIFGGAFIVGDPETDMPVIGALAEWCAVEIIAPRYRLAPEYPAPAASDDCFAVYRAMVADEPDRLLLSGESAGGNLALLTAQRAVAAGLRVPAALGLLSPAADLRTDRALFGPSADADPSISHQRAIDLASVYPGELSLDDPQISPLFGSMDGLPPTIITTASRDLLLPMCLRLVRKLRRSNVEVDCTVWDGLWHVFEFYDDFPESAESLGEIAAFLNTR